MSILKPTDIYGEATWLGVNSNRDAGLESTSLAQVRVDFTGFEGEAHGGLTRPSCSRVKRQYQRGTEIRNSRQITILSDEELSAIGEDLTLGTPVDPAWIGGNLVMRGIARLTEVSPGSRIIFEGGVALTVDMENAPCKFPAAVIERYHPGKGLRFAVVANGRRGLTAWVERTGVIKKGERARLHLPPQRIYLSD